MASNTDAAFGLRPVRQLDGSPWNGMVEQYLIPSGDGTAIYVGDLVKKEGSTGAGAAGTVVNGQDVEGMPTAIVANAGDTTLDRKSTRLNSSHIQKSRMPSSA